MAQPRIKLSRIAAQAAAVVIRIYLRIVWATSRVQVIGAEARDQERTRLPGGLLACWHGRLFFGLYESTQGLKPAMLASRSPDAQLLMDIMRPWNLDEIRGSSDTHGKDKGGSAALKGAISYLSERPGRYIIITPDGPRGPRGIAKPGAALISVKSDKHVIPLGFSCTWGYVFGNMWDQLLLPLPFGKFVIVWGAPLRPPEAKGNTEAFRQDIEAAINAAQAEADAIAGRKLPHRPVSAEAAP